MVGGPDDVLGDHKIKKICLSWDEDFTNNHTDDVGDKKYGCEGKHTEYISYFHHFQVCSHWGIFHENIDDADDDMEESNQGGAND